MANCIKCNRVISDEESRARYEELCKMGIIPKMVPLCLDCRMNAWAKEDKVYPTKEGN